MVHSLVLLAALASTHAIPTLPASGSPEITAAGPGLALRVSSAAAHVADEGLAIRVAPVHVGWQLRDGVLGKPSRFGVATVSLAYGDWLEARGLELNELDSARIRTRSVYVNPLSLTLRHALPVVPGLLELSLRLDLTFSLWQSTRDLDAPLPPPLPCSSGSIAQATVDAAILDLLGVGLVAGVSDDPVHFGDGSDCLGGGDVWRSSAWLGGRATVRWGHTWSLIFEAGLSAEELHSVVENSDEHAGHVHAHEHVALRNSSGFDGGAWLAAGF